MGYTYKANKESRKRQDLRRLAKSALITLGVMAAMVGYQVNSGPSTGITSASANSVAKSSLTSQNVSTLK